MAKTGRPSRSRRVPRFVNGAPAGEYHGNAKWPAALVREARTRRKQGETLAAISQTLGVPLTTVADWCSWTTRWHWVDTDPESPAPASIAEARPRHKPEAIPIPNSWGDDALVSVSDIAELCNVTAAAVLRWRRLGRLPPPIPLDLEEGEEPGVGHTRYRWTVRSLRAHTVLAELDL